MNQPYPRRPRPTRLLLALICLGVLPALAGTGGCTNSEVRSGSSARVEKAALVTPPAFVLQWTDDLQLPDAKRDPVVSLFVREDRLFAYTRNGTSYVITRAVGVTEHADEVPGGGSRLHPPVLLAGHIVYPTIASLEVYDTKGIYLRSIPAGGSIRSDAVGDGRANVFVTVDQPGSSRVNRYNMILLAGRPAPPLGQQLPDRGGRAEWSLMAYHGGIPAAPAWYADVVYVAGTDGLVTAVSTEDRNPIWPIEHEHTPTNGMFDARSPVVANLAADDSGLYVPTSGGRMYCIDRINGTVKWQFFAKAPPLNKPAVLGSDTVYIEDPGQGFVALDKVPPAPVAGKPSKPQYNRDPRWVSSTIKQILAQDDHFTYALRKDDSIVAMDKRTGESNFSARRKDLSVFATNVKDGTIYAATTDGRIVAIKAVTTPGVVAPLVR